MFVQYVNKASDKLTPRKKDETIVNDIAVVTRWQHMFAAKYENNGRAHSDAQRAPYSDCIL